MMCELLPCWGCGVIEQTGGNFVPRPRQSTTSCLYFESVVVWKGALASWTASDRPGDEL